MSIPEPTVTTLIFDLDGVIWRGEAPVPGAADALSRLAEAGLRCLFATNNSSQSPQHFVEKLARCGVVATLEQIVTSSTATARFLREEVQRGALPSAFTCYAVGEAGLHAALAGAGGTLVDEFALRADVVIVGIDRQFNYAKLQAAQRLILQGARFLATNLDATFPIEGSVVPGAGCMVSAVATACGQQPLALGKPEPLMLQLVLRQFGAQASESIMVGDRLDTDIACGRRAGLRAWLVGTGVNSLQEAAQATGDQRPDQARATLNELVDLVMEANGAAAPPAR